MKRRTLWLIAGILGVTILVTLVLGGGGLALLLALSALFGQVPAVTSVLQAAGLVALGIGLGVPLAVQGWAGWQERRSRPFNPSQTRWFWLALLPLQLILVVLGAAVSLIPLAPIFLLPPIHALAMSIPPLLVLGLVGWGLRGRGGSRREATAGMASGGCLGMGLSLIGEILILFVVIVVAVMVVMITPGAAEQINELVKDMRNPAWQTDIAKMSSLILSPVVIANVFGILCIATPLIEETAKALAGGIVGFWVRPHPARAFLWGVAAGAGFALAENLFNGAAGGAESWVLGAVTRLGTTAMHCFTSGLVGWGCGQLWASRRPLRSLGAYAAAVFIHGLWNAAAIGMAFSSIAILAYAGDLIRVGLAGLVALTSVATLILLTLVFVVALPLIALRLASLEERRQVGEVGAPATSVPEPIEVSTL
jgi:RsiW-degrading membrane proteinase PrsW (M82 family)